MIFFVVFLSFGCARAAGGQHLDIGYIEWDENVANSTLAKVLAEDELGYDVDLRKSDLRPVVQGVADGETDVFMDAWMPAHQQVIDDVGGGVTVSEEPWYEGETEFGIAVPDYMEDVRSIEDLNGAGVDMITGIEPGALLMDRISSRVIPEYGLDLALVEASTPAMLSELDAAYEKREPIVFIAWSPHWMNLAYKFHYLKDPKGTMDGIVDGSKLHMIYREGLAEDDPVAFALLDSMRLTEDQTNEIELEIVEAENPEVGVRAWLEDNRDVVKPWLDAATAAG